MKINQEIFDALLNNIGYNEKRIENIKEIIKLYKALSEEEKKSIDFSNFEKILNLHFENEDMDFNMTYEYAEYKPDFKKELDKRVYYQVGMTKTQCKYLLTKETTDIYFINISIKAIKGLMIDSETRLNLINQIKELAIQRNLYDTIINKIKTCGDIQTIVNAALSYEPKLIDEVFEGKPNMYLYLVANTFTDCEDIEFYKERLLNMNNNEFDNYLVNKANKIDEKILSKKI